MLLFQQIGGGLQGSILLCWQLELMVLGKGTSCLFFFFFLFHSLNVVFLSTLAECLDQDKQLKQCSLAEARW